MILEIAKISLHSLVENLTLLLSIDLAKSSCNFLEYFSGKGIVGTFTKYLLECGYIILSKTLYFLDTLFVFSLSSLFFVLSSSTLKDRIPSICVKNPLTGKEVELRRMKLAQSVSNINRILAVLFSSPIHG